MFKFQKYFLNVDWRDHRAVFNFASGHLQWGSFQLTCLHFSSLFTHLSWSCVSVTSFQLQLKSSNWLYFCSFFSHLFPCIQIHNGGGLYFKINAAFTKWCYISAFEMTFFSGTVKQHPVRRICFDAWCVIGAVVQSGWRMLQRLSFFLFVCVSMIVYVMYKKIQTKRRWCRLGQKQLMEQSQRHRCLWSEVKRKW